MKEIIINQKKQFANISLKVIANSVKTAFINMKKSRIIHNLNIPIISKFANIIYKEIANTETSVTTYILKKTVN